ncbi:MAG: HNH endonuclease [Desulfocapsa sp.]|nr:HNH endonuclease [Desulfocapsa sp.]
MTYISVKTRQLIAQRAEFRCEYCLIHEEDTFFGCEIDHIISKKHGGGNDLENLAYACLFCNRHKGTDVGSIHPTTGELIRLFNPRKDHWDKHFQLNGAIIKPLTDIGEITVRLFALNNQERLLERDALVSTGAYPAPKPFKQ